MNMVEKVAEKEIKKAELGKKLENAKKAEKACLDRFNSELKQGKDVSKESRELKFAAEKTKGLLKDLNALN